jgi:hypothetical protein
MIAGGPPKGAPRSSEAIGSFWNEPTLQGHKVSRTDRCNVLEVIAKSSAGPGKTTSSQIGQFYESEYGAQYGPIEAPITAYNRNSVRCKLHAHTPPNQCAIIADWSTTVLHFPTPCVACAREQSTSTTNLFSCHHALPRRKERL